MVRLGLPNRLKNYNGKGGDTTSQPSSRGTSPMRAPADTKGLILKTNVLRARNLAAKDKSGTSDPFLVIHLGDSKQSTPTVSKNLNPEWNVCFDLPLDSIQDVLLEAVCWDRDRFGKDYLGEFDVVVEDIFANGNTMQEPKWYTLESRRKGAKKKGTKISGEVQLQFTLVDTSDPSARSKDVLHKLTVMTALSPEDDEDDEDLSRLDSIDPDSADEDEDEDEIDEKNPETSDSTDEPGKPAKGSTLRESTIDSFFDRYASEGDTQDPLLTFNQAVMALEDQLRQPLRRKTWGDTMRGYMDNAHFSTQGNGEDKGSHGSEVPAMEGYSEKPLNNDEGRSAVPTISQDDLGSPGEGGDLLEENDLVDERGEEHVVEIRECPLCHQPRLNKKSDADIITHIATCASQDWRQVNNIVMAGFVTASQAQRKWYSKVITKISYGGYKLGANSANILVQDRISGQINEERMSVYVRIGIRLLYKGLKSREMEKKRNVYSENIRYVVPIDSVAHGRVMVICVGAMMVGSTIITRKPGEEVHRAEELGYFKFGGSTILLLFEPGRMQFDDDLIDNSSGALETLLRVGTSIGHSPEQPQYTPDMPKKEEHVTHAERQEAKRRIEGSLAPSTTISGPSSMK
ncbi:phosphatidylserine decarboxylase, partial [Lecanoromycetidae sp. Uapishka_2]